METRFFTPSDYALFCEWCDIHGVDPLPIAYLPDTGIVVSNDDEPIAMIWLYFDDSSPVCFADRAITRPGIPLKETVESLAAAAEKAKELAIGNGMELMLLRAPKGIARYAVSIGGFDVEEQEVVNLAFRLVREEDLCPG